MRKAFLGAFLILILCTSPSYSHPHLFIKPAVEFINNGKAMTSLRVRWMWDEWWSEDVKMECDLDGNNLFDKKETAQVKKSFFDGVEDFNYFLKIKIDQKEIEIKGIRDFAVNVLPDGNVAYEFTVDFPKGSLPKNEIEIYFVDKTIYTAFEEDVVLIKNKVNIKKKKTAPYADYGVKLTVWL